MKVAAYFNNISQIIKESINGAEEEILIAVAWFTNEDIYNSLLSRKKHMRDKLKISLIIINDKINIKPLGLDFQKLIDLGGKFYLGSYQTPMHNKYCVIDKNIIITGSYNYTYLAEQVNNENVMLLTGDSDNVKSYRENFFRLIKNIECITSLSQFTLNNPPKESLLSNNTFEYRDMSQKMYHLEKLNNYEEAIMLDNYLKGSYDSSFLEEFTIDTVNYRQWDEDYYIDKVVAEKSKLILHFRTHTGIGSWVYGPETNHCWYLRDSDKKQILAKVSSVKNLTINRKILIISLNSRTLYYLGIDKSNFNGNHDSGYEKDLQGYPIDFSGKKVPIELIMVPKNYELTCELHFDINAAGLTKIDLIEGLGKEKSTSNWHCFEINLKLNRRLA